jgi:hypothetical protein
MWKPAAHATVSGAIAQETRSGTNFAGGSLAAGYEAFFPVEPAVNRTFYGEFFGVEARGHFLRSLGDSDTWLIQAGGAFSAAKLPKEGPLDRLRYPAFYPLLLPEIGAAFQRDEPASAYFRWSAPFSFLIHKNVAIELSPSVSLLAPTPKPNPNVLIALDLGLSVREIPRHDSYGDVMESEVEWDGSWGSYFCFHDEWEERRLLARQDRVDLGPALPYRRYFAVTRVMPVAHHFVVTPSASHWGNVVLRAKRSTTGQIAVEWDKAAWGGVPAEAELEPLPPNLQSLAAEVEAQARKRCQPEGPIAVRYAGAHRDIIVQEFVVHRTLENPPRTIGWQTRHGVAMDEGLTRVLRSQSVALGLDQLEIPKGSQWLPSSGAPAFKPPDPPVLPAALASEISGAARRFDLGTEPAEIEALVPADQPRIPAELTAHVLVTLSLNVPLEQAPISKIEVVPLSLTLRDAVFGPQAKGQVEASAGDVRYTIRATLTPTSKIPNLRGFRSGTYDGTLTVHVEDDVGRAWDQSFEVSGVLQLDGSGVLAPNGLTVSTAPPPSPPSAKLRGELPRKGPAPRVLLFLAADLPQVEGK